MVEIQNNLLQIEKERIKDVLDIMLPIEYGFISKKDGSKITDREWIHDAKPEELEACYEVNTDPEVTIKNQLGICQDQAIAIRYLMRKYHPEDPVCLFALTKPPKGHCVACYEHNGKWYYLETSWDKERGLHGPFNSKDNIKNYLKQMYFSHHKNDTPAASETKVTAYHEPVTEGQRVVPEMTNGEFVKAFKKFTKELQQLPETELIKKLDITPGEAKLGEPIFITKNGYIINAADIEKDQESVAHADVITNAFLKQSSITRDTLFKGLTNKQIDNWFDSNFNVQDYMILQLDWLKLNLGTRSEDGDVFIVLPTELTYSQHAALKEILYDLWIEHQTSDKLIQIYDCANDEPHYYNMSECDPEYIMDRIDTYYRTGTLLNEDLKDDAKAYFGTTYNPSICFYINTDGTLLDGSGLKLGSDGSRRTIDHREISDIMPDGTEGTEAMLEYMCEGNIRYMPETNGFDLIKEPTDMQYHAIESLLGRYTWKKEAYVDFSAENGDVLDSIIVPAGRSVADAIKQHFSRVLTEDTRNQLIAKSRNAGAYKYNVRGKNRFERKKFSKLASQVQKYNQIDMNAFFKQDQLLVTIPVQGETAEYNVVIKLDGVLAEIARNIKANNGKFEYRTVMQAVTKIFNTTNVYVKCSCDDFKYRFDHWSIINKWGANDSAHDPGPGKGIANPANDKGNGCKHILLALANGAWIMKICSVIVNYINYMDKNRHDAFIAAIFPKLYGVPADAAEEAGIVPPETDLKSDKNLVNTINQWAANRGKFVKGSNKNPVTGTGGKPQNANNERTTV